MAYLIDTLAGNTMVALALATLALITMRLGKPALAHALWLLVLVKLVTPALVRTPVPAETVRRWTPAPVAATFADADADHADMTWGDRPENVPADPVTTVAKADATPAVTWPRIISITWAAGSLAILALAGARIAWFRRTLKSAERADDALLAEVDELARLVGLDWSPDVLVVAREAGPLVYFDTLCRPALVVPARLLAKLPAKRRRAILTHELAHLRRRDHWVRLLELPVAAALWWHPLVWLARRGLRAAEEQCCDAWVLHTLPDARHDYASALVDVVEHLSAVAAAAPPVATGLGQLKHLRRRLIMIATRTPSRGLTLAARAVVTGALLALPVTPALVRAQQDPPPDAADVQQDAAMARKLSRPAAQVQEVAPPPEKLHSPEARERKIQELEDRISELEMRLALAEQYGTKAIQQAAAARQHQADAIRAKAWSRMRQDAQKYGPAELSACEKLYQEANANLGAPEAKAKLQQVIERWPDTNRAGCAAMYLAQQTQGDERMKWLRLAIDKYSDCYYGDGVQVGAYARYYLATTYREQGDQAKARITFDELLKKYPNAIDHRGDSLAKAVEDLNGETK